MEKVLKLYRISEKVLLTAMFFSVLLNNVEAQTLTLQGTGATNIMAYAQWWINFFWWGSLGLCSISCCTAGVIMASGDQNGWNKMKLAIYGTGFTAGVMGFLKYVVFGAQSAGVSNNGDLM